MELTDIISALPGMEMEDVQTVWREAENEAKKRFAERSLTCQHPEAQRAVTEVPRPGRFIAVCKFCWTHLPSVPVQIGDGTKPTWEKT